MHSVIAEFEAQVANPVTSEIIDAYNLLLQHGPFRNRSCSRLSVSAVNGIRITQAWWSGGDEGSDED